jgi:Fic family protein
MKENISSLIIDYLKEYPSTSSTNMYEALQVEVSFATFKRLLAKLVDEGLISTQGRQKSVKYILSPAYDVLRPIDVKAYFEKEVDERVIKNTFDLRLIPEVLSQTKLFTDKELEDLSRLQKEFEENISNLSSTLYSKEMERLAIDLSWKSSQIEGNTYSLLETERLLKEKETAAGKSKDDAVMLLNHKEAIDFIVANPDYVVPLTIRALEDIHSLLVKDLGVDRNIRQRRVGISGTNYVPLDNEHQIREALNDMCELINAKESVFEKSLLALVLLSYIQAFADGNKRTARIISNSILVAYQYCPISFRTVDSVDYKKAMLIFYEQNNIDAFKEIFKSQFEFAVKTYF